MALAIGFGLIVSAGIYFTMMWPDVEPQDPDEPRDNDEGTDDSAALD
jgi:hypothetical protein